MIKDILTHHGDWKEVNDYNTTQKPAFFELSALKQAIGDHIVEYKHQCGNNYMECIRGIKPNIGVFNIYGRIVHKKAKGCSYFYVLLCTHDKKMGGIAPVIKLKVI